VSPFAGAGNAIVTGLELTAGTTALVAPVLWAASPTATDSGVSRTGIEATRDFSRGLREVLDPSYRRVREALGA